MTKIKVMDTTMYKLQSYVMGLKRNRYFDFLTKEDQLQIEVFNYIKIKFPNVVCWHTPNEGKRTRFEQWKTKIMGLRAGVSDLIIIFQREYEDDTGRKFIASGLAIELKVIYKTGKKNTCTPAQKQFLVDMNDNGFVTAVCWTFEQAKKQIDSYLKL